jgi:hypothetical protein
MSPPLSILLVISGVALISYLAFFQYIIQGSMIPTGHLLMQSASSVVVAAFLLEKDGNYKIQAIFLFLALCLHYVSVIYFIISLLAKNIFPQSPILRHVLFISKSRIVGFLLAFSVFFILAKYLPSLIEIFRGYNQDSTLGVSVDLFKVLTKSFALLAIAILLHTVLKNIRIKRSVACSVPFLPETNFLFSLGLISFFSFLLWLHFPGLAYRINYINFTLSPVIIFFIILMLIAILHSAVASNRAWILK